MFKRTSTAASGEVALDVEFTRNFDVLLVARLRSFNATGTHFWLLTFVTFAENT